jgi:hypothetical protein
MDGGVGDVGWDGAEIRSMGDGEVGRGKEQEMREWCVQRVIRVSWRSEQFLGRDGWVDLQAAHLLVLD